MRRGEARRAEVGRRDAAARHAGAPVGRIVDACRRCQDQCLEAVSHALRRGGSYADEDLIGALLDATDVCRTTIDFLRRGSRVRGWTCAVCAEICERAAEACEGFGDDLTLRACAEACRRCAEACREIAPEGWLARVS